MNRSALLRRISALSFTSWELHLYLDTHPEDGEARKRLEETQKKLDTFTEEYEKTYGPLTVGNASEDATRWLDDPWPWDYNFGGTK